MQASASSGAPARTPRFNPGLWASLFGILLMAVSLVGGCSGALLSPGVLPLSDSEGTPGNDVLRAGTEGGLFPGFAGDDAMYGGPGADVMIGGYGDDFFEVAGGGRDHVSCGLGADLVNADRSDVISAACETVYLSP